MCHANKAWHAKSYHAKLCQSWFTDNAAHITEGIEYNSQRMNESGHKQAVTALNGKNPCKFCGEDASPYTLAVDIPVTIYTYERCIADMRPCAWPFKGVRSTVSVLEGTFVITIFPPSLLTQHQDVSGWTKTVDASELKGVESFVLSPQEPLYIPFGWQPVVCCVTGELLAKKTRGRKPKPGAEEGGRGSIAVQLLLDGEVDREHWPELVTLVSTSYTSAQNWVMPIVRTAIEKAGR